MNARSSKSKQDAATASVQARSALPAWQALAAHREQAAGLNMRELFREDPGRFHRLSLRRAGLWLDYSKNLINDETLKLLVRLAEEAELPEAIAAMFRGDMINRSEERPALHIALRNMRGNAIEVDGEDIMPMIQDTLSRMEKFTWRVHSGQWRGMTGKPFRDVVNIGIGGSFLGPKLVSAALRPFWNHAINCHYVANIDGSHITEVLKYLSPETTLFIVASKSFTTPETLSNARAARQWFVQNGGREDQIHKHFVAVTAREERAVEFGVRPKNIFPMWDWVGGRYSLWSAIGLPILLAVGMEHFRMLLRGAHEMDEHFRTAPLTENMPVLMALLGVWYGNFWGATSHAILPYDHYLRGLPAHLQQLDMESNGKSVTHEGEPVDYMTGPIIWGGVGANGQHAYHQLLHQGTHLVPSDFIIPLQTHNPVDHHHALLFANCLSQSQALMHGRTEEEAYEALRAAGMKKADARRLAPHKTIPGNRPSNTIVFRKANPRTVGALIALYEHKVFTQGVIWNVNSFDQWGVELGKELGRTVYERLRDPDLKIDLDGSTSGLCDLFLNADRQI